MLGVGDAVGVRRHLAVEHEDLAPATLAPHQFAQVVIGAPVAQAELEDRPGQVTDELHRRVENRDLGLDALEEQVQSAHAAPDSLSARRAVRWYARGGGPVRA